MATSQALIPWEPVSNNGVVATQENSHPKGKKWALILNAFLSPSPGRTLDQIYTAAGKVLETHANRVAFKLGLGPHVIAGKIKLHFGDGEHRMQQLELLQTTVSKKIEKQCLKLMKYSLPSFKEIVDLATLLPGLRVLFLQTKVLENVTLLDTISAIWDRSTSPPDKEWTFWQKLAATCLADTMISVMTEGNSLADLVACDDEGLSTIEQLLVEHECGASKYTSALCLRYLAGVLNLPGFWQNSGCVHAQVAHKLCCQMVWVLKDIGVDIPALGLIEEAPVDHDGVDLLATTLLDGLSSWFSKLDRDDWAMQPWYESFAQVLRLLRDQNHTVPTEKSTHAANHSTDNLSAHSIVSDPDKENSGQSIEALDDSQSQTADLTLRKCLQRKTQQLKIRTPQKRMMLFLITGYEQQFGMASEHGDVLEDLINGTTGIPRISGAQSILASTPYLSPEAQCKDLEEWKLILLNKQRDFGDNHPETLDAMEKLAWLHHELGEYGSARDLRVTVLEKYQILRGGDHPSTLQALGCLGRAHIALGRYKEAQEVMKLALEKQRKVLGENHPETARTLGSLAIAYQFLGQLNKAQELAVGEDHPGSMYSMYILADIYRELGQFTEAEDQYHIIVEKSISIHGGNHPNTLGVMGGLGSTYLASGQLGKAEDLLTVVFDKQKKVLGEEHPDTIFTMGHLASTYNHLGQLSAAEDLATIAHEKCCKVLGESHSGTMWIMQELASIFQRQGQLEHAEELLIAVHENRRKLLGDDHPDTRWTTEELANLYQSMGKLQAAEKLERLMGDQEF
ncbi:hypothetical protein B0H14DRAFT_3773254 [Mycena olivaceomarginata]|nr:hypothetical protein B0H14DRAFT_3773254 [Mycena olivaceomarginata]